MKIAVATDNNQVSSHFGHCKAFSVFNTSEAMIIGKEQLQNPGHKPGFLPKFLAENDIKVIIYGGMGAKAVELFDNHGIEVITGSTGFVDDVTQLYLDGQLKSTGSICHQHSHADSCGNH